MPRGLDFLNKYQEIVKEKTLVYLRDYHKLKQNIQTAPIKHNGASVGFLYNPLFYSQGEIAEFKNVCYSLANILEKIIKEYLKNTEFRKLFSFSKELEELILIEPGYDFSFPMARFDIFYNFQSGDLKFCELNADGSSGMTKSLLLDKEFLTNCQVINELKRSVNIGCFDPVNTWVKALLDNYRKFSYSNKKQISIAIVDINWREQGMVTEFQAFQSRLEELGHYVEICDPRELRYTRGKLCYKNKAIDLIYRRAVTSDLLDIYSDIQDLLKAVKERAVCLVGAFRSQIIHNKQIFAILHNSQKLDFLTSKELEFINNYIPYTAVFEKSKSSKLLNEPGKWVLKPLDAYQSQGVYIGKDYTQEKWQEIIEKVPSGEYLLQEYIGVPKLPLVNYHDEELLEEEFNQMIGLFLYNKELTGFYTRVSPLNNVASGLGAVAVPNLIVDI